MYKYFGISPFLIALWISCAFSRDVNVFSFQPPVIETDNYLMDIPSFSVLELSCTGESPISWNLPNQKNANINDSRITIQKSQNTSESTNRYRSRLIIENATYIDSGSYSCFYEGTTDFEHKDNVTSVYVFVNDATHLFLEKSMTSHPLILVQQHKRIVIPCLPTSSKINVTLWKLETEKEGGELLSLNNSDVQFDPTEGFILFYPTVYFTGVFQCRAALGKREQHANFTLVYFPDTLRYPQPYINMSEALHPIVNKTFTLKCTVEVDIGTKVFLYWSYPNKYSPRINETMATSKTKTSETTGFVHQVITSYLIVQNATLSDSGDYRCSVTDHSNKMGNYNVTVTVHSSKPPTHVNFSSDIDLNVPVVYRAGQDVKFIITIKAFPAMSDVELYWLKDGEPLPADSRYHRKTAGNMVKLEIEKLASSDAGIYTLVGKTSDTENNISIILDVKAKPTVMMKPMPKFFRLNQRYNLECVARSYPANFVMWWKWKPCSQILGCNASDPNENWVDVEPRTHSPNGESVSSDHQSLGLSESNRISTRSFSSILHVTSRQSGHYKCIASNIEGEDYQIVPFMVTDASNGFEIFSSDMKPVERDTVVLTCRVNTYDYSKVEWNGNFSSIPHIEVLTVSSNYSHVTSIMFRRIQLNQSGEYECIAFSENNNETTSQKIEINVQKIEAPKFNYTNMKGNTIPVDPGSLQEFFCYVSGVPEPIISWQKDGHPFDVTNMSGVELADRNQRLTVKRLLDKDSGLYECLAQNRGGKIKANISLNVLAEDKVYLKNNLTTSEIIIIIVFVVVGLILFTLVFCLIQRIRQERKQKEELTFLSQTAFERGYVEILNPSLPLEEQIDLLPYKHQYEFPKERLKLGKTLGQGAFGRVVKAEAIGLVHGEASTTVAVKMLKETANNEQRKALIAELKILIYLERHVNIVNLLGAVTKNIRKGELMVIVEYCCFGNLRHFLLKHKGTFINQLNPMTGELDIDDGLEDSNNVTQLSQNSYANIFNMAMDNPSYGKHVLQYADLVHNLNNYDSGVESSSLPPNYQTCAFENANRRIQEMKNEDETSKHRDVTTRDLLVYSFQCARGMDYLASKKLIHRDLAARNVLLTNNNVVKICDFGLTKDGYNYVKKKNDGGLLPVKWLALESIHHKVFTTKSDVWSFGILLWEIFTLGGNPYPGIEFNYEFVKKLEDGYRMEKPSLAPRSIYQIMKSCWVDNPENRPDFSQLSEKIGALLEAGVQKYYVELNTPYTVMNEEFINNNDYLQMTKSTANSNTAETNNSQRNKIYDTIPLVSSISDLLVPKDIMENVPMTEFDNPVNSHNCQNVLESQGTLKSFSRDGLLNQQNVDVERKPQWRNSADNPFNVQNGDIGKHHKYVNGFICNMDDCEISTRC